MKLATALAERADLQRRIAQLNTRLINNAKVQDGEEPAEEPKALLKELDSCTARLEELMAAINLTNSATKADGKTVTELLAHRDVLKIRLQSLRAFLDSASAKTDRYSHTEIKIKSTVNVAEMQKEVDLLSKQLREADERIQEINWTTELK
ncbi:MAG: DIP1984 family protein [Oscillospiraceae bacterium]|nr:DIP1984 family protein [Oscillospiraceae bacterium]